MDASKWTQANTLKGVDSIIFPISWESQCFQIWKRKNHDYTELRNRN